MKKNVLFLLMLLTSFSVLAQRGRTKPGENFWFGLNVKYGYGTTILTNKNLLKGDDQVTPGYWNPSSCYGGGLMFHLTNSVSIGVEYLPGNYQQTFSVAGDSSYTKNIKLKFVDIPIMLRFMSPEKRSYVEFGISISSLNNATETYTNTNFTVPEPCIKDCYKTSATKIVVGFGFPIFKQEKFDITFGFRMFYSLTPLSDVSNYPFQENIHTPKWDSKTNQFSTLGVIEFRYSLGYFATSSCGRKKGFILF